MITKNNELKTLNGKHEALIASSSRENKRLSIITTINGKDIQIDFVIYLHGKAIYTTKKVNNAIEKYNKIEANSND